MEIPKLIINKIDKKTTQNRQTIRTCKKKKKKKTSEEQVKIKVEIRWWSHGASVSPEGEGSR